MTTRNWKRTIAGSSFALLLIAGAAGTQMVSAGGINEAGLETLGVTEETYDTAKESAVSAYNNEMVALGWVTAEEAAEETEEGDFVRIGRGD